MLESEILNILAHLSQAGEKIRNHEYHATLKLTGDESARHLVGEEPSSYSMVDLAGKKNLLSSSRAGEEESLDNIFGVAPSAGARAPDTGKVSQQTS
mmetsp:Transcript_10017/g.15200  ORF Transcript_10017/g.15200 Transcript_10017/m.15200 type:complete len:97 (+) Transcript_10017:2109-2399(+)